VNQPVSESATAMAATACWVIHFLFRSLSGKESVAQRCGRPGDVALRITSRSVGKAGRDRAIPGSCVCRNPEANCGTDRQIAPRGPGSCGIPAPLRVRSESCNSYRQRDRKPLEKLSRDAKVVCPADTPRDSGGRRFWPVLVWYVA
jgi:hypothetical protein